jgi:hypothetical protein
LQFSKFKQSEPVNSNQGYVEKRGSEVRIEEKGEDLAEDIIENPCLVNVSGCRQGQVYCTEEQVGETKTENEPSCGMASELCVFP